MSKAEYNEEVCRYLHQKTSYYDWVVTTAFYSAMHYVYESIFPYVSEGKIFSNFEKYFFRYKKANDNKHRFTIRMIGELKSNEVRTKYKLLFDLSHKARYKDYKISSSIANQSINLLEDIKDEFI